MPRRGGLLLRVLRVGICGTDKDIIAGFYGEARAGSEFLLLGNRVLFGYVDANKTYFLKGVEDLSRIRME